MSKSSLHLASQLVSFNYIKMNYTLLHSLTRRQTERLSNGAIKWNPFNILNPLSMTNGLQLHAVISTSPLHFVSIYPPPSQYGNITTSDSLCPQFASSNGWATFLILIRIFIKSDRVSYAAETLTVSRVPSTDSTRSVKEDQSRLLFFPGDFLHLI